ncbi:putative acetyltransferase [Arboricoccus pini]|uniref:Putative acetyltransferase n=1 Tax=Arboricoccus pini TaxID=1963835 RepID=A0A212RDZ6_9PROT|nr:N-acetyltransferase [Arboricoccus pini]SNB70514.1 putative acetyltransferase [Arboricoccus pini]
MLIRPTRREDRLTVLALIELAFNGADEARVVAQLYRSDEQEIEFVAEIEGEIVGHLMMTSLTVEGIHALAVGPLCVHPFARNQGIGSALLQRGLDTARGRGCEAVFVVGEPSFYRRFGFTRTTSASLAGLYQGCLLQVLELKPGRLGRAGPELRFADAFAQFG